MNAFGVREGVHYWLGNWAGVDCAKFFPAFLMYNKGKLTGFGWATAGKFEYSSHTEFPPYAALNVRFAASTPCGRNTLLLVVLETGSGLHAEVLRRNGRLHNHAHLLQRRAVESPLLDFCDVLR